MLVLIVLVRAVEALNIIVAGLEHGAAEHSQRKTFLDRNLCLTRELRAVRHRTRVLPTVRQHPLAVSHRAQNNGWRERITLCDFNKLKRREL